MDNWNSIQMHDDCALCEAATEAAVAHAIATDAESATSSYSSQEDTRIVLHQAKVTKATREEKPWCDSCSGPFTDDWLMERYGGHWDTCPRRARAIL
jgi:hypothetical protein